ncbi:MAG: ribulose-phosphate 3-epimerase [Planctomycetes bacterium]|nr:ribulose-phosphate 3-epimerase [Planctomycetota bacterium]
MIRIAPSLLACDFARIAEEVRRVEEAGADWLHLDVMDGHFVPNLTIGPPVVEKIAAVARVPLDVHVMITDPLAFAPRFLDAGAQVYTFHVEAPCDARAVIEQVKGRGRRAGMALNPDTPAAALKPFAADLDLILVMSVFPGFGGQRFIAGVLAKVREIRYDWGFRGDVQIDGGIDPDTIGACAAAGANVFVAGSAVFGAPDIKARIAEMRRRAQASASPSD